MCECNDKKFKIITPILIMIGMSVAFLGGFATSSKTTYDTIQKASNKSIVGNKMIVDIGFMYQFSKSYEELAKMYMNSEKEKMLLIDELNKYKKRDMQ